MNSVVSTEGAKSWTIDIKNFNSNTSMQQYEYMRLCFDILPPKIFQKYNLDALKISDGWIYIEIRKGMYG